MAPTFPSHAERATHPIWAAFWQQHACHQVDQSQEDKPAAEVQAVHADPPAPCHPKAAAANGRPHLAAWLRASRWAGAICRSITSPMASSPLSNHQQPSNRRPHRMFLGQHRFLAPFEGRCDRVVAGEQGLRSRLTDLGGHQRDSQTARGLLKMRGRPGAPGGTAQESRPVTGTRMEVGVSHIGFLDFSLHPVAVRQPCRTVKRPDTQPGSQ
jgi:hypothetical protein